MSDLNLKMGSSTEKRRNDRPGSSYPSPKGNGLWLISQIILLMICLGLLFKQNEIYLDGILNSRAGNDAVTDSGAGWDKITPSEKLEWHSCGYPFQCARLTVPMDYHRPLNESAGNPKVHIALVMVPGADRSRDPASFSESPLLLNPGGPGGSGATFALQTGRMLQGVVGNQHDVIGFDPRGVGATTPTANCFATSDDPQGLNGDNIALINRLSWIISGHDVGLVNSSNVALSKIDARAKALGKLCKKVDNLEGENSIFRHANTANVARDMLSIIDAWDEWRATSKTPKSQNHQVSPADEASTDGEDSRTGPTHSTQGKLVYWGFSYGTLLGATFAAMFPDRVGRVVLDGVIDADHYVGPTWIDSLIDTDAIWDQFFVDCYEAGQACKLFRSGDTVEDIEDRFYSLMDKLQKQPAIAISTVPDANMPGLITASDVKTIVFASLYAPIAAFSGLADLLDIIVEDRLDQITGPALIPKLCHNLDLPVWPNDAQLVVMCSDKRYKLNDDVPALQELYEKMASYSRFADVLMGLNLGCNGWEIETKDPPMRWDDNPARKPAPINTSFPLLLLSNRHDPVTPLHAALKMTRKFANASIVEQISDGHCTISCISACTIKHVRAYINDGVLPPAPKFDSEDEGDWATCECNEKPWNLFNLQEAGRDAVESGKADDRTIEELQIMGFYSETRSHFVSQWMTQLVGEFNPLRKFVIDAQLHPWKQQTCSGRGPPNETGVP